MHLVDTTLFFALEGGGVRRYLLAKQNWLRRYTNVRHTIVAPGPVDAPNRAGIATVRSPPLLLSNGYRFPLRLNRWREQLVELAPDLIEAGDPYGPAWAALNAGQQLGIPVVGFYHSDLARLVGARFGRVGERAAARYVQRLYRHFDAVVAPSRFICERLRALGIEQVTRQPLGVDTELFHPDKRDPLLRRELGLPEKTRLLVFAGRFAREKNLPLLLSAMRRLGSGYHLLLVGSGMSVHAQANVTVYPYQTGDGSLARLIASCDALVHGGHQETFGLVVLEAMASGLPVVAVNQGAVTELVDEQYGVLVPPSDKRAFADGIVSLCERDLAMLGRRARAAAEKHYSWNPVMRSLLAFYQQQLAASFPQPAREAYG